MKASIHPQYNHQAQVICVCGNKFTVGSTKDVIHIELCNKCHPFYTGEQRFVDTASRIDKFTKKQEKAKVYQATVTKKKEDTKKKDESPKTLREMLMALKYPHNIVSMHSSHPMYTKTKSSYRILTFSTFDF